MSSLLEKSLDEIIGSGSSRPERSRKRSGNRNRGSRVSKPARRGAGPAPRRNSLRGAPLRSAGSPNEIKITNLHPELTNEDITQLMETVGPTTRVEIKYNTHGKSIGVAFVEYEFGRDAMEAIKRFDGRLAAGQIISVSSTMPLIDRIGGSSGRSSRRRGGSKAAAPPADGAEKAAKPKKKERRTLEDLDNELSMYMTGEAPAGEQPAGEQPVAEPAAEAAAPIQEDTAAAAAAQAPAPEPAVEVPAENGVEPANNDVAME